MAAPQSYGGLRRRSRYACNGAMQHAGIMYGSMLCINLILKSHLHFRDIEIIFVSLLCSKRTLTFHESVKYEVCYLNVN